MGSVGKTSSSTPSGASAKVNTMNAFDFAKDMDSSAMSTAEQRAAVQQLQNEMGQTGDEAGRIDVAGRQKLYVNTSKAFDINYFLNTGKVGGSRLSQWTDLGYDRRMIEQDIRKIDSGMKPMSQPVIGYRYVSAGSLSRMLGLGGAADATATANSIFNDTSGKTLNAFKNVLKTANYTQNAYTSLSYDKRHSTFDAMPIRLRVVVARGTPAIVTNNHPEHEILAGRGLKYNFTGDARVVTERASSSGRNQKYLEIDVTL